jgi:hypothetical protein
MQQDVIHQVHEQLLSRPAARLSRPAARAIEAPGKGGKGWHRAKGKGKGGAEENEQLHVDHRPSMSDLEAKGREQESIRIKLKAFARVAHKLHQKTAFHGLCKAVDLQKTDDFDWTGSESDPPAVWLYYGRYGTSHGSASIKKPSPQIPRASKKTAQQKGEHLYLEARTEAQLSNSAADQSKAGANPASAQGPAGGSSTTSSPPIAAAGDRAEVEGGAPEEPSSPSSHNSDESDTSDAEDAEFQTWRCNRRIFNAEQIAKIKCNRLNLVSHQDCQRCRFPRFDDEEVEVILPPPTPPQTQPNNKGTARATKVSSKSDKKASKNTTKATVAKVAKPKPKARVDVSQFIDEEAKDSGGENVYDTDAAEQLRKEAESSLEEQSDEDGTSLVAHLYLFQKTTPRTLGCAPPSCTKENMRSESWRLVPSLWLSRWMQRRS